MKNKIIDQAFNDKANELKNKISALCKEYDVEDNLFIGVKGEISMLKIEMDSQVLEACLYEMFKVLDKEAQHCFLERLVKDIMNDSIKA